MKMSWLSGNNPPITWIPSPLSLPLPLPFDSHLQECGPVLEVCNTSPIVCWLFLWLLLLEPLVPFWEPYQPVLQSLTQVQWPDHFMNYEMEAALHDMLSVITSCFWSKQLLWFKYARNNLPSPITGLLHFHYDITCLFSEFLPVWFWVIRVWYISMVVFAI